jgi:hypothetical protein
MIDRLEVLGSQPISHCPSGARPEVAGQVRCLLGVAVQSTPLRHKAGGDTLASLGHCRPRPRAEGETTVRLHADRICLRMDAHRRPCVGGSMIDRLEVLGSQPISHCPSGARPEVAGQVRCLLGVAVQSTPLRHKAGGDTLASLGHCRPRPRAEGETTVRLHADRICLRMDAHRRPCVGGSMIDRLEVLGSQPISHSPSGARPEVTGQV